MSTILKRALPLALFAFVLGPLATAARATTIWTGPLITFTEPAGGSPTVPANQDRLTSNVWLTRNTFQGLFNAAVESGYTHNSSPSGTEWAYGSLNDYASLSYASWEEMFGGRFGGGGGSTIGKDAVVHLIANDIYLSVKFTSWGGSSGGFSYLRSTPVPEPSMTALALGAFGLWGAGRRRRAGSS